MRKKVHNRRKKIRIAEILLRPWVGGILHALLLLISTFGTLEGGELSIRGSGTGEYWVYGGDYQEHFESKLEVSLSHKGFLGRVGYFIWEPSQYGVSMRYPVFSLGYSASPIDIVVGHYYATFGRGLVLREYLDKGFKHDKSLIGVKLSGDFSPISLTLLSGRPRNLLFRPALPVSISDGVARGETTTEQWVYEVVNDTTDLLRGADLSFTLSRRISLGGSYLRLVTESDIEPSAFTELFGGNFNYAIGDWDSYFEYAQQLRCSAARGRVRGEGIYFSFSGGLAGIGLTTQYTDYRDLALGGSDYQYNDPPTPLRSGLSINRGLDERGGSTMLSASPTPLLYVEVEYGFLESHDQSQWAGEWHGDLEYDVSEALCVFLGIDRSHEREIEPGIRKVDTRPRLGVHYYLGSGDGIELELSHASIEEQEISEKTDYAERSLSLSYSHLPSISATVRAESRSKKVERLSPKTFWLLAEVVADLRPNLSVRLIAGSIKGGLVCSGGVCRFEPDFEGVKTILSYIF